MLSLTDPTVKIYGCALPPGLSEGSEVLNRESGLLAYVRICENRLKKQSNFFNVSNSILKCIFKSS